MRIRTNKADFTFSTTTSTEYQEWINVFMDAFKKTHPHSKKNNNEDIDDIDDFEPNNNTVENIDPGMFIPYTQQATLGRSRSTNSNKAEKPLLGRLFSQCIPDSSNNNNNNTSRQGNSNRNHSNHGGVNYRRRIPSASPQHRASHANTRTPVPSSALNPKKVDSVRPISPSVNPHITLPSTLPESPVTKTIITTAPPTPETYNEMPPLSPAQAATVNSAVVAAASVLPSPPPA